MVAYFSMEIALELSHYVNGVTRRHGEVSRSMFPSYPMGSITNGVHSTTWTAPSFAALYDRYIPDWRHDPPPVSLAASGPLPPLLTGLGATRLPASAIESWKPKGAVDQLMGGSGQQRVPRCWGKLCPVGRRWDYVGGAPALKIRMTPHTLFRPEGGGVPSAGHRVGSVAQ